MIALVLIAQIVLGVYFLYNAYNHLIKNRAGLTGYAQMRGVPAPAPSVVVTGFMLLGAGLGLLLGYQVRIAAWLAIVFLVLVAFLVHHFWTDEGMERAGQIAHFGKNLALAAALLLVTYLSNDVWVIRLGP
ncbi:MAG: DoxX family protein [Armatimonadota bacterium]|nr:DoxX family protein [Armatimonadota bacterium]